MLPFCQEKWKQFTALQLGCAVRIGLVARMNSTIFQTGPSSLSMEETEVDAMWSNPL